MASPHFFFFLLALEVHDPTLSGVEQNRKWFFQIRNIKHKFKFKYHIVAKLVREVKNSYIPAWVEINDLKWALHLCHQKRGNVNKMNNILKQKITVTMDSHLCPGRYSFWY